MVDWAHSTNQLTNFTSTETIGTPDTTLYGWLGPEHNYLPNFMSTETNTQGSGFPQRPRGLLRSGSPTKTHTEA